MNLRACGWAVSLLLAASGTASAESSPPGAAPRVVAPTDSYPRIVSRPGLVCEEDLDAHGCVLDRCREPGAPRDVEAPGKVVGASDAAPHPERCQVGAQEAMPEHRQAEGVRAEPAPNVVGDQQLRAFASPRLRAPDLRPADPLPARYLPGIDTDRAALFLARTRVDTSASEGWSLPLKFIAVGGAVALPFLVADAAITGSSTGGNATGAVVATVVDVVVAGVCALIAVVVDNNAKVAVEREASDARLPGAQP